MFPIIEVSGGPRERGFAYGAQARGRIRRSVATYAALFAWCGIDWAAAQRLAAGYREAIGDADPGLLAEIEGIAEGSGFATGEILALNCRTELLPAGYPGTVSPSRQGCLAANRGAGVPDWAECTAIAVLPEASATGGTLLAQNWDWLGAQREALVLLRLEDGAAGGLLTLTEAGMLAKIGFNGAGLGVCLNILRSTRDGERPGLPVHVLLRALLGCTSVAEAGQLVHAHGYGASSNVLCADTTSAASFECAPAGVGVLRPQAGTLLHTNHFLCADAPGDLGPLARSLSTVPRLERARALRAAHGRLGLPQLQALLRDESDGFLSICRRPDPALAAEVRLESVAGVVIELAEGRMHVAPGLPSQTRFVPVALASVPA